MTLSKKIPLWLDCDTGHDDAFAISLAAHHDRINLLGVSTVHGNASLDHTTPNTCAVLQACGRYDVPIIVGEARPLVGEPSFAPEIHGISGLDGVPLLPVPYPEKLSALRQGTKHIAEAVLAQPPNTVWIVATGPLTNIAKAMSENIELAAHIRGLSIMGGAVGGGFTNAPMHRTDGPGNWTPFAEFNIFCDPHAAHFIFNNVDLAPKTTLIPLDLTHQCRGTASVQELLFGPGKRSQFRRMMQQILTFFAETYRVHSGIMDGPPLHDPLAVYAVIHPDKFDDSHGERWSINTQLLGNQAGQISLIPAIGAGVRVPRGMDVAAFWQTIDMALSQTENYLSGAGHVA